MNERDPFAGWFAEPEAAAAGGAVSDTRWAFAPLIAVLVVLAVLAWVAVLVGGNDVREPDRIADLTARAERLRGLTLTGPIAVERLDRSELSGLMERLLTEDLDPDLSQGADDALHLMGVLRPGQALDEVVRAGLTRQVAGLYEPKADRLYLIKTRGAEATGSTVLHEIVHAIQDQRFNLDGPNFGANVEDEDGQAAAQALAEGDALEVQTRFIAEQGLGGLLGELGGAVNQLEGTPADQLRLPDYLQRSLEFPYTEGIRFVQALREEGGQDLLDRAFADPPDTTLAILEPERYIEGEDTSVTVDMPPPPSRARRVFDASFGASDIFALTGDRDRALDWRGGRVVVDRTGARGRLEIRIVTADPYGARDALREVLPADTTLTVSGSTLTASRTAAL